ncbi:fimbrial protein [Pseudomonas sp. McL0111]|uniref:fimbrial protein n=1 Tax=Pseudomonas sp. McL0111 TaxID=3457357 RepID=UPI00403E589D
MKQQLLCMALILSGVSAQTVHAATTGTLRAEGLIINGTCNLAAIGVDPIKLATVKSSDFDHQQSVAPKNFQLTANCEPEVRNVTFIFSGTPSSADGGRFANTGTAAGVALGLVSSDGRAIRADGTDNTRLIPVVATKAVIPLTASYWKVGPVTEGTLVSQVIVKITYD